MKIRESGDQKMANVIESNHREFFRLQLKNALSSDMRIIRINGKIIETAYKEVLIDDIGPGGLRFLSDLNLPVNPSVIWEFRTELLGQPIELSGYVVRAKELEKGIYQYGLKFIIDEKERLTLIKMCNELALKLRQSSVNKGSRFIGINKIQFFKHQREQLRK
jgi:hypothetical protein